MTAKHFTQSPPHPPKQPLYLSPDVLQACFDIDKNGIDSANQDSLIKLEFLAVCLTTEVINFGQRYPAIHPAGLLLQVDVLLPVSEPTNVSQWIKPNNGEGQ